MAGRITIAEVEELVEPGEIDPNAVHSRACSCSGCPMHGAKGHREAHGAALMGR